MPRAPGVGGGDTPVPLLSGPCLPMVLPCQPRWEPGAWKWGHLARRGGGRQAASGSALSGPGFPPLSSWARWGLLSLGLGGGGPPSAREDSGEEAGRAGRTDTSIPPVPAANPRPSGAPAAGRPALGLGLRAQCSSRAHPPGSPRRRHIAAPARRPRGRSARLRRLRAAWGLRSHPGRRPPPRARIRAAPTPAEPGPAPRLPSRHPPGGPAPPGPRRPLASGPVRPAGQPFPARPAESPRGPHPRRRRAQPARAAREKSLLCAPGKGLEALPKRFLILSLHERRGRGYCPEDTGQRARSSRERHGPRSP